MAGVRGPVSNLDPLQIAPTQQTEAGRYTSQTGGTPQTNVFSGAAPLTGGVPGLAGLATPRANMPAYGPLSGVGPSQPVNTSSQTYKGQIVPYALDVNKMYQALMAPPPTNPYQNALNLPNAGRPGYTFDPAHNAWVLINPMQSPANVPYQTMQLAGPGPLGYGNTNGGYANFAGGYGPAQWLADFTKNTRPLVNLAQAPTPFDTTPAWQKMIDAQQRNISANLAQLGEQFNVSGGRFSTAFGNAATDYMTQTSKDQDALLAQMQYSASESAAQRQLQAAGALGGYGFQAGSQLGNYDFQNSQTQQLYDFQSQMAQYNSALQAAQMLGGGADLALGQLGQYGYGASNSLLNNSMLASQLMFGGANTAATGMYDAANAALPQWMNYDATLRQLGLGAAGQYTGYNQAQLGLGNTLAMGQYGTLQNQINSAYQEWLRTQPFYNPLLQMMFSASTGQAQTNTVTTPSFWDYFAQIAGAGLGAAGAAMGRSDARIKENITPIDAPSLGGIHFYAFNFKPGYGPHDPQIGLLAQEVERVYPDVVYELDGIKHINYAALRLKEFE